MAHIHSEGTNNCCIFFLFVLNRNSCYKVVRLMEESSLLLFTLAAALVAEDFKRAKASIRHQAQWSNILWFLATKHGLLPWAFSFSGKDSLCWAPQDPQLGFSGHHITARDTACLLLERRRKQNINVSPWICLLWRGLTIFTNNSNWLYKTIWKLTFLGKMQFELNTITFGMENELVIELLK